METGAKDELGTVYFPISFAILIPLLWSQPALLVVSLMPLTWGDAFAAIIGSRFGRHKFTIFDKTRSIEGSITMFVFSFAASFIALLVFVTPLATALPLALGIALVAALVEAVSPLGIDNLTVPLATAAVLVLLDGIAAK
jgi:phytol kinase